MCRIDPNPAHQTGRPQRAEPRSEQVIELGPNPPSPMALVDPDLDRVDAGLARPPRWGKTADPHHAARLHSNPLFTPTIRDLVGLLRPVARNRQRLTIGFLLGVDLDDTSIVTGDSWSKRERSLVA